MAGNYGGNSIPTTPVSGDLITGAAYSGYQCTTAYATTASGAFTYGGVTFNFTDPGEQVELVMDANGISATDAKVIFLCYECSGCDPLAFSGITTPGEGALSSAYSGMSAMNRPTIIGGSGLNN